MQDRTLHDRIAAIEDKLAIKELVDTFSNLADQFDTHAQTFLFTEDATVDSYMDGKLAISATGRQQIGDTFSGFLKNFEKSYHLNGQQTLTITGDRATGTAYCSVTLFGPEDGQQMKTSFGVRYQDEYARVNGQWLIARRTSDFMWQEKRAV